MLIRLQFGCWAMGALLNLTTLGPVYAQITGLSEPCEIADNPFIARLNSAIKEPRIVARLPGIECIAYVTKIEQKYSDVTRVGETVVVQLRQDRKTLQQGEWSTRFPAVYFANINNFSRFAEVPVVDLLTKLLRAGVFTQEDFAELPSQRLQKLELPPRTTSWTQCCLLNWRLPTMKMVMSAASPPEGSPSRRAGS
jgi:hypothetical protein